MKKLPIIRYLLVTDNMVEWAQDIAALIQGEITVQQNGYIVKSPNVCYYIVSNPTDEILGELLTRTIHLVTLDKELTWKQYLTVYNFTTSARYSTTENGCVQNFTGEASE